MKFIKHHFQTFLRRTIPIAKICDNSGIKSATVAHSRQTLFQDKYFQSDKRKIVLSSDADLAWNSTSEKYYLKKITTTEYMYL